MKILHIAPIGHHAEGIGTVLHKLVPLQIKLGMDVRIISVYENKTYEHLPLFTMRKKNKFQAFIEDWWPDVVLFHSMYQMEYISFSKVLRSKNIPYAVQMHGALSEENYRKNHWKKWMANLVWWNDFIKNAARIIFLNKAEYDKCVVNNLNSSYAFIPNGCDRPNGITTFKVGQETIDICFIGRILFYHKGIDLLLEALSILKKKDYRGVSISFYGNEDDIDIILLKKELEKLKGLASYKGAVYGKDKDAVLRNCSIFILTSRYEGMPMGVLEALSYGIPCILTPGTNMVNEISMAKAGWVSQPTPEAIAETIERACNDFRQDYLKLRSNVLKLSEFYDWDNIAKLSQEIFTIIVNDNI